MAVFRLTDFLTHAARQFLDFGDARLRHPQVHLLKAQFFGALYIGFLPLCCRDSHVLKNPLNVQIFVLHRMMKTKADQALHEGSDP